jgi:ribonuclease HI
LKSRIPRKIIKDIAPQAIIVTDAAPSGWGATIVESNTRKILTQGFGKWTPQISSPTTSSNRRELIGVHKVVELALPIIRENNWISIKILTDNQTTAYNVNRKAAARSLIQITRKFLDMIQKEGLLVKADYIPGEENQIADSLIRLETVGDYTLQPKVFWKAVRYLKFQPNVDLFASEYNHLLPTFGSL